MSKCWCGGDVGPRSPGDDQGNGCLENITHNWKGRDICGVRNPVTGNRCVAKIRHIHHRDDVGRQWPSGDPDQILVQAQLMDDLGELLSYCRDRTGDQSEVNSDLDASDAYEDVFLKLVAILDGEQ